MLNSSTPVGGEPVERLLAVRVRDEVEADVAEPEVVPQLLDHDLAVGERRAVGARDDDVARAPTVPEGVAHDRATSIVRVESTGVVDLAQPDR